MVSRLIQYAYVTKCLDNKKRRKKCCENVRTGMKECEKERASESNSDITKNKDIDKRKIMLI